MTQSKPRIQITGDKLEALRQTIKEAPEPAIEHRKLTKQDAIRELYSDIEVLIKKGYTIEAVAEILTNGGVEINAVTLKSYLQRVKGAAPKKTRTKKATQGEIFSDAKKDAGQAAKPEATAKQAPQAEKGKTEVKQAGFVKPDTSEI